MAQNPINTFSSATYIGGYHIKCNGQSTGSIKANPSFGTAPYTFSWSSGETTAQINNKPAGVYIVTMTDSINVSHSDTFELRQPKALNSQSTLSDFYGYNIHRHGGTSGSIQLSGIGGTPPYTYLWSNGDSLDTRNGLTVGNYSFTITDANQCSASGSIALTEPNPVQFSFTNIQHVQCFGGTDGAATLDISGGLGNFSVVWNNGNFSLSPNDLTAGYNEVRIYEQGRAIIDTGITINAPPQLEVAFTLSQYNNGFNVSCVDCYNGSITSTVTGGTAPYNYLWNDENNSTTANLNNLNGGVYGLKITDAHGCKMGDGVTLKMPSPKDWSRFGNANIDTAEFIGSTDTSAVVFKSNNQKAMILSPNEITLKSALKLENVSVADSTETLRMVGLSSDGTIKSLGNADYDFRPDEDQTWMCNISGHLTPWQHPVLSDITTTLPVGPEVTTEIITCPDLNVGIGVIRVASNIKLHVKGKIKIDNELFCVKPNGSGSVGIGTNNPIGRLDVRNVNDAVAFRVTNTGYVGVGIDNPAEKMHVVGNSILDGNVRIGNDNSTINDTKLAVEGIIYAREMKVTQGVIWPDYVFKKSYQIRSLKETEKFIAANGHLPEIPAASEIEKNGLSIAEMLTLQMKKIEELTLYVIEQQKKIEKLESELYKNK